jgi:hypothetical protein
VIFVIFVVFVVNSLTFMNHQVRKEHEILPLEFLVLFVLFVL